jgi:hypothetical protein
MKQTGSESCTIVCLGSGVVDRGPGSTTTLLQHQNRVLHQDFFLESDFQGGHFSDAFYIRTRVTFPKCTFVVVLRYFFA